MKTTPAGSSAPLETPTDARLVAQCATLDSRAALAQIVQRHGRVVYSVCRMILGTGHDADDAYQSTFLVMARRASAIQKPEALASWLCGVATRVAVRLKTRRTRWSSSEPVERIPTRCPEPIELAAASDQSALVAEELGLLPEKYRTPLVLCYLEGRTTEEAAACLNCPVGTFKSRLARGRDLLRGRVTRRGLVLASATIVGLLLSSRVQACPPLTEAAIEPASTSISAFREAMLSSTGAFGRTGSVLAASVVAVGVVVGSIGICSFTGERDKGTARPDQTPPPTAPLNSTGPIAGPGLPPGIQFKAASLFPRDTRTNPTRNA